MSDKIRKSDVFWTWKSGFRKLNTVDISFNVKAKCKLMNCQVKMKIVIKFRKGISETYTDTEVFK